MKIILILALAKTISKHNQFTFNKSFQSFDVILKIIGVIFPTALILLQNDLGTTLVICVQVCC